MTDYLYFISIEKSILILTLIGKNPQEIMKVVSRKKKSNQEKAIHEKNSSVKVRHKKSLKNICK